MADNSNEQKAQWFAYRLLTGEIHVKLLTTPYALEEAWESTLVDEVLDPYLAGSRSEAEEIAKRKLKQGTE